MSNNPNYKSKIQFKQQICDKPHIYKITNLIDNKYYYGVHDGSDTEIYEGSGKLLKQAYKKYGKENFIKEILMWFDTEEEAYEYEEVVVNEKMINKNNPMCYNLVIGGKGGDKYSDLTPERQTEISKKISNSAKKAWNNKTEEKKEEIRQKKIDIWNNKTEEEKVAISQKLSDAYNNKTEEEKVAISQKLSETFSGEKNPMFGQNPLANKTEEEKITIKQKKIDTWNNKTEEEKVAISQKHSDAYNNKTEEQKEEIRQKRINTLNNRTEEQKEETRQKLSETFSGEKNPMFGQNPLANKTEEEMREISQTRSDIASRKYYCPHNQSIQRDARNMVQYIRKNYPNEKQWSEFTKEEKQNYLVVSQDASGCIQNQN